MTRTPTRAQVESAVEAARRGKSGAADVLRAHMAYFHNLSVSVAPGSADKPNERADPVKFERWSRIACECAKALIGFEAPRLAPIASPVGTFEAETIEAKPEATVDPTRLSDRELVALYRSKIASGPGAGPRVCESAPQPAPAAADGDRASSGSEEPTVSIPAAGEPRTRAAAPAFANGAPVEEPEGPLGAVEITSEPEIIPPPQVRLPAPTKVIPIETNPWAAALARSRYMAPRRPRW
jgi:hypothetical protein